MKSEAEYWQARKDFQYYKIVRQWLDELTSAHALDTILDVGSYSTPVAQWGRFDERIALDKQEITTPCAGVRYVQADWFDSDETASVLTCLQTIEHLNTIAEARGFTEKLLRAASVAVIISVPYMQPHTREGQHPLDPIGLPKLLSITGGRRPARLAYAEDTDAVSAHTAIRLVGMWKGLRS